MKERISLGKKIKQLLPKGRPKHFSYSTLSVLVLVLFLAAAVIITHTAADPLSPIQITVLSVAVVFSALLLCAFPLWPMVFLLVVLYWVGGYTLGTEGIYLPLAVISAGVLVSPSFQVIQHWDKAVVLRLGRFNRICGPGPHLIIPIIETASQYVDTRIRVTDFSAEQSLTMDTVPVHVDALAFWMVWDPQKTILEVERYEDAVILSAQTALRDTIGKNSLATLLSQRERLGAEIQRTLDAKTNPWGITILSIEFKEILVPKELEDVLSKQAQAERERHSRLILGEAEVEVAKKFEEASQVYRENPTAFQLRGMNMVYDSIKTHGGMVLMPSSAVDSMSLGTSMGAAALSKLQEHEKTQEHPEKKPDDREADTGDTEHEGNSQS